MKLKVIFCLLTFLSNDFCKYYDLQNDPIDLVMPCHPKDKETLDLCIEGAKSNISGIRRVIVVSEYKLTENAEWVPESAYPFNKYTIAIEAFGNKSTAKKYMKNPKNRAGWIFKQLTNLYHMRVIPGLSTNVLVIDCDTIFMRPVTFLDEQGNGLYAPGTENYKFYFEHGARIIPGFKKVFPQHSGISHHMLFQKNILDDMLHVIEENGKDEAWKVICRALDRSEIYKSPMADYELYFNFAFMNTDQLKIRPLAWLNAPDYNVKKYQQAQKYDFVSFHTYMR